MDLKPCQLKPKRQKSDSCGEYTAGSQWFLWFIVPSALPLWGQVPPDLVKMKRTSESTTCFLKMCRNYFFYFLIYVPFPLHNVCTNCYPIMLTEKCEASQPLRKPPDCPHPSTPSQKERGRKKRKKTIKKKKCINNPRCQTQARKLVCLFFNLPAFQLTAVFRSLRSCQAARRLKAGLGNGWCVTI